MVVGAGVIGLSVAWHCRQAGHDVVVIDRDEQRGNGCSIGNAGLIVPSHFVPLAAPGMVGMGLRMMLKPNSPFFIQPRLSMDLIRWMWKFKNACSKRNVDAAAPLLRDMHLRSRECYLNLANELEEEFGLQQRGLLMLCKTESMLHEESETAKMAESLGIPVEILDRSSVASLDPNIEMDVIGGVYYPKDCHLSPSSLINAIKNRLVADGVEFSWSTPCQGFSLAGSRIDSVLTPEGTLSGDVFVLSSGVWSSDLADQLRLSLPMQAGKGYSVTLPDPPQQPTVSSILTEARVAVTPMGQTLRFGGTMELAGINDSINEARVQGIIDSIPDYFPRFRDVSIDASTAWSGLRPVSPDGLPYLGPTRNWDNLYIASGHAMMGVSLAMVSGEMICQWISGKTPHQNRLQLLSPDRYSL